MQDNLIVLNLWLEYKFKGYKYLNKWKRKKLYKNTRLIVENFNNFLQSYNLNSSQTDTVINRSKLNNKTIDNVEKLKYLSAIMSFLRPGPRYEYLEGASFGKLLKDIQKEKMIGDCNQIVTFYTFLYSLKYKVSDLEIKLLPGHVCLHFQGVDIEATNGTFQHYTDYQKILPIHELIATNLLDTCDFRDKQLKINSRQFVKGAQLAQNISSANEITNKNLNVAYHNLALDLANNKDFRGAKFYLDKINDPRLTETIFHNAVLYHTKNKDFKKAKYFANLSHKQDLLNYVTEQEGWYYFKNNNFSKAISIFSKGSNDEMVKACYARMYNKIQKRVASLKSIEQQKVHKQDYLKMAELAGKMGDYKLQDQIKEIIKKL